MNGCLSLYVAAHLSDGLDGCAIFDQQLHHLHSVLLAGYVQRSESILSREHRSIMAAPLIAFITATLQSSHLPPPIP